MRQLHVIRILALAATLAGCANVAAIDIEQAIVGAVAGKLVNSPFLDPVFAFFGISPEREARANVIREMTPDIVRQVEAAWRADRVGPLRFECMSSPAESREDCSRRAAFEAEERVDRYAMGLSEAFRKCRDFVVLTPATGAMDYTDNVRQITQCVANQGYQGEVAALRRASR
jgi:hypothetical protein